MESIVNLIKFGVVFCVVILICSALYGYACSSCNKKNVYVDTMTMEKNQCNPILPNGEKNMHYENLWESCKNKCGNKFAFLDIRFCECKCQ